MRVAHWFLAGCAVTWCGAAQAAPCSPADLMAKVDTYTELLAHKLQESSASRRATAARMHAAMRRQQAGVADYDAVCDAYDDLINQARR